MDQDRTARTRLFAAALAWAVLASGVLDATGQDLAVRASDHRAGLVAGVVLLGLVWLGRRWARLLLGVPVAFWAITLTLVGLSGGWSALPMAGDLWVVTLVLASPALREQTRSTRTIAASAQAPRPDVRV